MADLYDTDLGPNTRKVQPTSTLGTRQLQFYCVNVMGELWNNGDYSDPDSLYARVVRAIQQYAELYFLGAPDSDVTNSFVFAVANDTVTHTNNPGIGDINQGLNELDIPYNVSPLYAIGDIID